jgi:ribosome biogenesis GTPase / thiamine phosphate phosphatase
MLPSMEPPAAVPTASRRLSTKRARPISEELAPQVAPAQRLEGLVIGGSRGFYDIQTAQGTFTCTIRGRLRKQLEYGEGGGRFKGVRKVRVLDHDPVSAGDRVQFQPTGPATGVIDWVAPRERGALSRRDPAGGELTLTTVAGIDQLICVFAARQPEPHLRLLDRLLVLAELQELDGVVCLNKVDLGVDRALQARMEVYRDAGYPVLFTSAVDRRGIEGLRAQLAGKTSAFVGPSGVGKTSLLNDLQPDLGERTGAVSAATNKGRHTTTGTRLYRLDQPAGGYIADTAGIRALGLTDDALEQLDECFPEFRPFLGSCRLGDCTHIHEPGCTVRTAVRSHRIDAKRYDSYRRLRNEGSEALEEAWSEAD